MITDKEASSAVVSSFVHNEDGVVKESEATASHVTVQGSEQAVPSTIGATSEATKDVSFPSFPTSLQTNILTSTDRKGHS